MTRIRQWLIALAVTAVLCLSFGPIASADPGDGGAGNFTGSSDSTAFDPGDGGAGW